MYGNLPCKMRMFVYLGLLLCLCDTYGSIECMYVCICMYYVSQTVPLTGDKIQSVTVAIVRNNS